MSVREDGISLFGFLSREDLEIYRMLIGVSGIGPKAALAVLSTLEFPAHADAVVVDVEFVERILFFIVRFLNDTDNDGAAVLCEFRGIAQQIQQNLVQAELVAEDNRNPPVL